ncbi:MAG: hypothetical protein ACYC9S_10960 [Leptospirales bacterium]
MASEDQTLKRGISLFFTRSIHRTELNQFLKKILGPYFVILLVFIAIGGWHQIGFHEGFNIGDWLINYQGGFVRRGFAGEILYLLARVTHLSPAILLLGLQDVLFSLYFYFSYRVLQTKTDLVKYVILIFSPFLFTFAINSQAGGYRKEIIYFAILAVITYAQQTYNPQKFQRTFLWILFLYPMVILTDELGLVILPLMIAVYWNKVRPSSSRIILYLSLLLLENAAIFLAVIFRHRVSIDQVNTIIKSLIQTGYDPNGTGGAIGALHSTTLANMKDTFHSIVYANYFLTYPIAFFLCSIAYLPLGKEIKEVFRNRILLLGYAGSLIILLPVFIIANDWGRWFYILLVELFMLILIIDDKKRENLGNLQKVYSVKSIVVLTLFLVFYAIFWYLPHVLENGSNWRAVFHNLPFVRL